MAVAIPFLVVAAEAAWAAVVYVGSAFAVAVGIKVAKDKIEERFSEEAPSAKQPCEPTTAPTVQPPVQMAPAKPWVDNPDAAAEHDAYKTIANQAPPPGLDPCEELKWKLQREEAVVQGMEQWDAKWLPGQPGRHVEAIEQRKGAIDKLKKQIKQTCK